MTVEANFSISVQTDADEGTAEIGDFEMFEKEIIVSPGQTCFEIKIILDAILENKETFKVSIESSDSALNVVVPQAEVTILDTTSKFSVYYIKHATVYPTSWAQLFATSKQHTSPLEPGKVFKD